MKPAYPIKNCCAIAIAPALLVLHVGCQSTVTPPANILNPETIYIAHYDTDHNSVVLPKQTDGSRVYVEYSYGDWRLYANYDQSWWNAFAGMTWPTGGALGRRTLEWDGQDLSMLVELLKSNEHCYAATPVVVEAEAAADLLSLLESRYDAGGLETIHNEAIGLTFVRDQRGYWFWHTCNHEVADWLNGIDCRVRGANPLGRFVVKHQDAELLPLSHETD
jgi:hypothetical protein